MKKFLIAVCIIIGLILLFDVLYYQFGFYIDFSPNREIATFMKTEGKTIYMQKDNKWTEFEIKGVDMGSGEPGEWATNYSIDKESYMRWFIQIQDMGANTIRIYTVQSPEFYSAFYEHNIKREEEGKEPLWLLHGVWVNDYVQHSHLDAYSNEFVKTFISDCRTMIDVIHGQRKINFGRKASSGSGTYKDDVSKWVIGYILGVEWEGDTVVYTNQVNEGIKPYSGEYVYATEEASPFENMLARVGDLTLKYEADKYKCQKLLAFSNWCTTDPFKYSIAVSMFWNKMAFVDVEHIKTTDKMISGHFASYHAYPYYQDYLNTVLIEKRYEESEWGRMLPKSNVYKYMQYKINNINAPYINDYISDEEYYDKNGKLNTYLAYLIALNRYHTIPVVISEFGVSTGRGIAQIDANTGRNQGHMSESDQGKALVECYDDIMQAGCAGCCIFSWQDEWFKRTWNTMYAVDLLRTPYWSDYQTNEQYFGLLSFDPGEDKSVCYVDGDVSEWSQQDKVSQNGEMTLSVKYDERFVYFLVNKKNIEQEGDVIYIPLDITPKSGSNYCVNYDVKFETEADFVIIVNGKDGSKLQVQERYEALRSTYSDEIYLKNAYFVNNIPDKKSNVFVDVNLALKLSTFESSIQDESGSEVFETGKLRHGNANPYHADFDSLADICISGDFAEIKLPWQLLNFSDPSRMQIHDDYYDGNYGVEHIKIKGIYAGLGDGKERIPMEYIAMKGWQNKPTYHERLKSSYYVMQKLWGSGEEE